MNMLDCGELAASIGCLSNSVQLYSMEPWWDQFELGMTKAEHHTICCRMLSIFGCMGCW